MKVPGWWLRFPLIILASLVCMLIGYVALATGLPDDVFIVKNRTSMLRKIEAASTSTPPDIESLVAALSGPDWSVAATAAEHIGQLGQSKRLKSDQTSIAVESLFKVLASGGHWWRFGWDRDEPEFEQFRGVAIEVISGFGPNALSSLLAALGSDCPFEREAACWITLSMLKNGSVDQATLSEQGIPELVGRLARYDPNKEVKAVCMSVQSRMANLQNP